MSELVEVRTGAYHDSVTLMRVSRRLSDLPGVTDALTAMATELNRDLMTQMGFQLPGEAGPNDLLVAVRADNDDAVAAALEALDAFLAEARRSPAAGAGDAAPPVPARTTGSAARDSGATLALISVPGQYAFAEAIDALEAGLNVMIFSDNVPVEQEIALKDEAARRGLLVMGPDCGTAVVGGVGLGFANSVRPGPIGLVAASGTGSQQVMCLLDEAGAGVSHALGVGGRDLSSEISGRSALQALAALDADPATELILVVSKPPAAEVADLIRSAARRLSTPTLFALLGPGPVNDADHLTAVAEKAVTTLGREVPEWPSWPSPVPQEPRDGALRGLFAGGTLCDEAMLIASERLGPVYSNIPLRPQWKLGDGLRATGHAMIDFGDDGLTQGRAHPMIDPRMRLDRLAAESADPSCAVVLLDVVLGFGAEADPAASLAPAIEQARARASAGGRDLAVVVSLCGTAGDPQDRKHQAEALQNAGAAVFVSNAAAVHHAASLIRS